MVRLRRLLPLPPLLLPPPPQQQQQLPRTARRGGAQRPVAGHVARGNSSAMRRGRSARSVPGRGRPGNVVTPRNRKIRLGQGRIVRRRMRTRRMRSEGLSLRFALLFALFGLARLARGRLTPEYCQSLFLRVQFVVQLDPSFCWLNGSAGALLAQVGRYLGYPGIWRLVTGPSQCTLFVLSVLKKGFRLWLMSGTAQMSG